MSQARHQHLVRSSGGGSVEFGSLRPETIVHSNKSLGWTDLVVHHLCHHPTDEIIYPGGANEHAVICRAGTGAKAWQVIGSKMACHSFQPGSITILPARQPCGWNWKDQEGHSTLLGLRPEFLQKVALEALDLDPGNVELVPRADIRDPEIEWIASRLLSEVVQAAPGGRVCVDALAQVLAVHLLRNHAATAVRSVKSHGLPRTTLRRVTDFLRENLAEDVSLADLAEVARMSSFHFARSFRNAMGVAPHQYLIRLRVERAKELLLQRQSEKSLAEIAVEAGFCDQSHFCRHFRRIVGVTPLRFQGESKKVS